MLTVEFLNAVLTSVAMRSREVIAIQDDWLSGFVARHDLSVRFHRGTLTANRCFWSERREFVKIITSLRLVRIMVLKHLG